MDILNLTPDAVPTADTTQNIEGYQDHVEEIQKAYPEEDWRTPAEIEAENQASQQQQQAPEGQPQPQDQVTDVANQVATQVGEQLGIQPQQPEQIQQQEQDTQEAEKEQRKAERTRHLTARVYDQETGDVHIDSILDWEGRKISELPNGKDVIKALKLTRDYSDKE